LLAFFASLSALVMTTTLRGADGPSVVVHPFDHLQVYETGASGYTRYRWTFDPARSENAGEALDWLFRDQDLEYIRNAFDQFSVAAEGKEQSIARYDIGDASSIIVTPTGKKYPEAAWQIEDYRFEAPDSRNMWVYNRAKMRNPGMKLLTYGHLIPKVFRVNNGNKNWQAWLLNRELPKLNEYLAKWMFANLLNLKLNEGVDVEILDIYNEADAINFGGDLNASWTVKTAQQRDAVAYLLHHVVPLLREWVNDPSRNRWGVRMPLISAPSCVDTANSARWLKFWYENRDNAGYPYRDAWDNIDIVSIHQYGGGYQEWPYRVIDSIRGGRPFMQNEMHMGDDVLARCPLPDPAVEDDLQASLLLGHFYAHCVNNGVSVYDYYMGVSALEKPESLLHFKDRRFTRRKIYHAYRQLTRSQPDDASVTRTEMVGVPDGFNAIAYHRWGDTLTHVTIVNRTAEDHDVRLTLLDHQSKPLPMTKLTASETSAGRNNEVVALVDLPGRPLEASVSVPAHSIRTFRVEFDRATRLVASDRCDAPELDGGEGWSKKAWSRQGSPPPRQVVVNKLPTYRLAGGSDSPASIECAFTEGVSATKSGFARFRYSAEKLAAGDRVVLEVSPSERNRWQEV
jgi:hypothetical protein